MWVSCFINKYVLNQSSWLTHNDNNCLDMLFGQLTTKPEDDSEEVYFVGEDGDTPVTNASQTLDLLALHLPPEKLVPHLVSWKKKHKFKIC